jgi:hypothetical protein
MALPHRPRWVYTDTGGAVDYTMSLPQLAWDFGSRGFGGSDVSGSGVPAAFEVRRDYLLHLTLRFTEAEWDDVERLVRHLQRSGSATFYPDTTAGTNHTVYGDAPKLEEEVRPSRTEEPSTLTLAITVRRTTQAIMNDEFYAAS